LRTVIRTPWRTEDHICVLFHFKLNSRATWVCSSVFLGREEVLGPTQTLESHVND